LLPSGVLCAGLRHCRNLDAVVGGCRTRRVWIVRMCELCPFVTLCCSVSSPTRAIRLERVALLLAVVLVDAVLVHAVGSDGGDAGTDPTVQVSRCGIRDRCGIHGRCGIRDRCGIHGRCAIHERSEWWWRWS